MRIMHFERLSSLGPPARSSSDRRGSKMLAKRDFAAACQTTFELTARRLRAACQTAFELTAERFRADCQRRRPPSRLAGMPARARAPLRSTVERDVCPHGALVDL